jgi:hypothetical protein
VLEDDERWQEVASSHAKENDDAREFSGDFVSRWQG